MDTALGIVLQSHAFLSQGELNTMRFKLNRRVVNLLIPIVLQAELTERQLYSSVLSSSFMSISSQRQVSAVFDKYDTW
jgi:hypothetical protein